ncbi:MAG: hypothetical protein IM607_12310 [Cytophagales bacterium]|nr:hypothetical protein [Cytophagales bacterium]
MSQVIIYTQDNGVVAVVYPAPEALALYGIEAIAQKDVPEGKPYKIIDKDELPASREMREGWTIDESELTDGFGAPGQQFPGA